MPRLLPAIDIDAIEPASERQVIAALMRDLPDECVILHSWETLRRDRGRNGRGVVRLIEGECDAVVLWPGKGMLVLEVKGGAIDFDPATGQWFSRDRHDVQHRIKDPFEQARRNMHTLIERLAKELGRSGQSLGFTFGYAVVLSSRRVLGSLPANADADILCDGTELDTIGAFIERALKRWAGKVDSNARPVSFQNVIDAMLPSMKLVPSLVARIDAEGSVLHRLTGEQAHFLEFARAQPRARVWGVAGSGKTLLAVQQARRFAKEGRRTLLLCYNRSLAAWLRDAVARDQETIDVYTFHEWCEKVVVAAGISFDVPSDPDDANLFWKETTAEWLLEHFTASGLNIDALVVDEGQDFRADWWAALECTLSDDTPVYVFYDEHQDLFSSDGAQALETWLPLRLDLPTNCRNTRAIASWCANIVSISPGVAARAPQGLAVTVEVDGDAIARRACVEKLVSAWLNDEKIAPGRIAILTPWRPERGCLASVTAIGGVPLTSSVADWQANAGVLLTTIRSFKGLEADALVMIDLPKPGSRAVFGMADFYVGCSRARNLLHLVASESFDRDYAVAAA